MDMENALKLAVADGKAVFGAREVRECLGRKKARAVIYADNAPDAPFYSTTKEVKTYRFPGGSIELGAACGKPFAVSVVAITDDSSANLFGE